MAVFTRHVRKLRLPLTGTFFALFGIAFLVTAFEVNEAYIFAAIGAISILFAVFLFWLKKTIKPGKLQRRKFIFSRWHLKGLFFGLFLILSSVSSAIFGHWYFRLTKDFSLFYPLMLFSALSFLEAIIVLALWFEKKPQ